MEDLEHARARETRHQRGGKGREGDAGQDEGGPSREARGGQPAQGDPEEQDQHDAEPEIGQGLAEHGQDGARDVVARASAHRGDDADGHAEDHGEKHGHEGELHGGGEALQDHLQGRRPVLE